jgi:murein DD-endopeptidase MepM/ murein hydrolase activator NlpD
VSFKNIQQNAEAEAAEESLNKSLDVFPNMLPVMGVISKPFSEEHTGIDFAAAMGESVFATASGNVIFASERDNLGLMVEIDHGGGIVTRYGHLSRFSVRKGASVRKGEIIGFVGNTGNSTSAHLHYEIVYNGKPVNPEKYF